MFIYIYIYIYDDNWFVTLVNSFITNELIFVKKKKKQILRKNRKRKKFQITIYFLKELFFLSLVLLRSLFSSWTLLEEISIAMILTSNLNKDTLHKTKNKTQNITHTYTRIYIYIYIYIYIISQEQIFYQTKSFWKSKETQKKRPTSYRIQESVSTPMRMFLRMRRKN